ncbi:MAG: ATP-binding protein [Bacteroidales bacterium]|nr:ATP-binding protein [Bacteroidales bacterium]
MPNLKIYNFGPIKNAEFDFKKVNVLIGQQGTGKSCVLKIMAFCLWLEKIYISGEITDLQRDMSQKQFVEKYLLVFYKLGDFVTVAENGYSKITFDGDDGNFKIFIDFKKKDNNWLNIIPIDAPQNSKHVAYIPAERCLVSAVPNLMDLKMQDTNIYKYLVDWEYAHKIYTEKNKLNILGLNAEFYYDEKSRTDYISVNDNGITKKIKFTNAASGFQSVVPICVLINYYLGDNRILSIKEKQRVDELKELLKYYIGQENIADDLNDKINTIGKIRDYNIFLEEPEENIFPEVQYRLMKFLFATMNNGYDNTLSIATHSPYTLTVLNNFIYAAKVGKINQGKVNEVIPEVLWQPTENVAAYYLNEGSAMSIIDEELGEIDPELIDKISQVINHEYGIIRSIEYEK